MSRNLQNRKLILKTTLRKNGPMKAAELTKLLEWHKSNVYRHLDALILRGTVRRVNASGGYLFEVV